MALITTQIQPSKFEAIRDRIALILAMELENQFVTFGDYELDLDVWTERGEKIDNADCPAIIVSLASGDFSSQHQGSYLGEYTYNVDIYSSKVSEDEDYGSTLSTIALHKIAGVCTKIIEDPQYKTLGFQAPSISHREVSSMIIAPPDPNDAAYVAVGRLVVKVNVVEGTDLLTALNFEGADTSVKLYNTNKGLLYSGSGYAPPLPSNQVQLLVNGDEFDIIDGGETFDLPVVDQDGNEVGQQIGNEFVVTITTCQDIKDCLGIDTINGEVDEFLNKRGQWVEITGGGAVDSVNGQTGDVVLDADDIDETATRFWLTDVLKSAYDAAVNWISTNGTNLLNHLTNTSNPHNTTAAQVGAPSGSGTSTGTNTGDQDLSGLQDKRIVVSTNTTAVNDGAYTLVASATFTDPTPSEGKGYSVLIRNGVATIGAVAYSTVGTLVWRLFHSGSWATYVLTNQTQLNAKQDTLVSATNIKTVNGNSLLGSGDLVIDANSFNPSKVIYYDDFIGWVLNQTANLPSTSHSGYAVFGGTPRISTMLTPFSDAAGVLQCETQASAISNALVGALDMSLRCGSGVINFTSRVRIETLSDGTNRFDIFSGLANRASFLNQPICFRYSDNVNSGKWQLVTQGATADSGITVNAGQWYILRIVVNAAGTSAEFFIDGVSVGTLGSLPTSSIALGAMYGFRKSIGTTNRNTYVDYQLASQDLNFAR